MRLSTFIAVFGIALGAIFPVPVWSSVTAIAPALTGQFATPVPSIADAQVAQIPSSPPESLDEIPPSTLLGGTQVVFTLAILLSSVALGYGVLAYTRHHRWQKLEFIRQIVREFEGDADIRTALRILDFEEYRDYQITTLGQEKPIVFKVTDELLLNALASHDERARKKKLLDQQLPDLDATALEEYQIETALRDWFNKLLNGLEHFGYLVSTKAVQAEELRPWLIYWVRLIADTAYRGNSSSRVYDHLYNYIHDYGFLGVQHLFEQFGYRVLKTPYQNNDLLLKEDISVYSTPLALILAKASLLIYQDIKYVAEICGCWGINLHNDFRYFNNKGRDTQAFMFRTDKFMVLAFRGSQEIRDWFTNFHTKLRIFTIRKEGITSISSYKGQVHTGFFLGWASIERDVLSQINRWQKDSLARGQMLPPLLITGHSLGGALATLAAASLIENGVQVAGLYTFGQPRVGDWQFSRQLSKKMDGRMFRFVNNNDIVPHVPPPFSPLNPFHPYGHSGTIRYFNTKGILLLNYKFATRLWDSLWGIGKGLFESGFDLIADHGMQYYISDLQRAVKQEREDRAATLLETDKGRV